MVQQLTLDLRLRDDATFANYYSGDNSELLSYLQLFCAQGDHAVTYLFGVAASGLSHLLQACCHAVTEHNGTAIYLSLKGGDVDPEILQNLEHISLICVDDLDHVIGRQDWEEAIFHLFNRLHMTGNRLLIAAKRRPTDIEFVLPDLQSRLASGMVLQLKQLTDEQMKVALIMRAKNRGLLLTSDVVNYLLTRFSRDANTLFMVLDRLDNESWRAGRKLTIPFVKEIVSS